MKIILDAFGGDHAPLAPLQGAELAIKPEEVLKQIRVAELIHAQNPLDVKF